MIDPEVLDAESIYASREQAKTHQEFEAAFGPVAVDTSDEALERAAAGGEALSPKQGLGVPQSASETVRAKQEATKATAPNMAEEALARVLGFKDAAEAREKLSKGDLGVGGALKMTDVVGNLGEMLGRERAEAMGLPADLTNKIATGAGLASILFPLPGKIGKGGAAMKAGARAVEGTNPSRLVGMTEDVQAVIKNIGAFNAQRMERGIVTHAETIANAQGTAPPLGKDLVRLYRGEGPGATGPATGAWFTTEQNAAQGFAGGGRVLYVDVPHEIATASKRPGAAFQERYVLPGEWASRAEPYQLSGGAMSLQEALTFDPTKFDLPTLRAAVAGHYAAAATYYTDLAKRVAAGDVAAQGEYWTAFSVVSELAAKDALLGTQLGRGLEASKIALAALRTRVSPQELQNLAELTAASGMDAATHAQRFLMLPANQRKTLMGQSLSLLKQGQNMFYELWINMLLSGPQTHATNALSNSLTAFWAPGERFLSALASAGEHVVTLGAHDRTVFFGESAQMVYGAVEGFKDGIRVLGRQLREETKLLRGQVPTAPSGPQKVERAPAITGEALGVRPESLLAHGVDYLGAWVRTPGRALATEDEIFKAHNYRMELRALSWREAAQEGKTGAALNARARYIREHADEFPSVKNRADTFALMQTFTRDFMDMGNIGRLGQAVATFADNFPGGRIVLPFVRTPTGLIHYTSERTPFLNLFADTWRADFAAGGERRALALGKIGGGAMASAVVATYAGSYIDPDNPTQYMTVITGAGPTTPAMRATLERQGWRPFSVWNPIDREYVSLNRLDPTLGMTFGIIASFIEIKGQIPEQGVTELAMASVVAMSKAVLSKTYLEGLSNFLDAMEGNAGDIARFFQGLARSGVPAAIRQFSRVQDPLKREADNLYDYWRQGLPGYDGPDSVNLWGDPVFYSGGLGPDLVSPLYASPYKPDEVDRWLSNNRVAIARTPRVVAGAPPPGAQMTPETGAEGIRLEAEEISRLGVLIGKGGDAPSRDIDLGPLEGQPPLKDVIRGIIQGPGTDGPQGSRADMVRAAHNTRRRLAIAQLRRESPMLDEAMTQKMEERIRMKIPDAGGNPMDNLLKSLR